MDNQQLADSKKSTQITKKIITKKIKMKSRNYCNIENENQNEPR